MTTALDMIRGRSNVVTLTNNSGGALAAGDVCVQDTSADEKATTTTSANSVLKVFVAAEAIASAAAGKFYSSGYCPLVTPSASVTRGRYLFTHTVAKQAAESATYGAGAFGVILKSGTTPSVWIFSTTAQATSGLSDGTWTDYSATSTIAGWSSFTTKQIYYKQVGKTIYVAYALAGTSNSTGVSFTVATASASGIAQVWFSSSRDNGGSYVVGYSHMNASSSQIDLYATAGAGAWTNSGTKEVYGQFWYITT